MTKRFRHVAAAMEVFHSSSLVLDVASGFLVGHFMIKGRGPDLAKKVA
jgi:hypothetical protein